MTTSWSKHARFYRSLFLHKNYHETCSIQDLTSGSHHAFWKHFMRKSLFKLITFQTKEKIKTEKNIKWMGQVWNYCLKSRGARLLIELFAKIAVSSILIVCTKTRIPDYCPKLMGYFCLLNQKKNVIQFYQTFKHTLFSANKGILSMFDLFDREKIFRQNFKIPVIV